MNRCSSMLALSLAFTILGCAEGGPGNQITSGGQSPASSTATTGSGGNGGGGGHGGGGHGGGGGNGGSGGGASSTGGAAPFAIVINEVSASGDDWVELGNASGADFDLGGFAIADTTSKGNPDPNDATKFADDTIVPAHGYVVVIGGEKDDGSGLPQTKCLDKTGPATCFYATWKLSDGDGDGAFLLDKDGAVVASMKLPPNAVADGQTYGRLPDITGDFAANQPTPGEPNRVP